ncbi:MAG: thioredoxin [Clostridia bacterium]|nr:thioredoxin [Clostridia bacterium]
MVKKVNESEFRQADLKGITVVDFSAAWCGPCRMMEPVLEELSKEMDGKVSFYNIDTDSNPKITTEYGVSMLPTLIIMKDGEKQELQIGFKPKEEIKKVIEKYL